MKLQHFLLTALLLFTGVGGVYATKLYVGFTAGSTHPNLQAALDAAKNNKDTVCVATGLYVADDAEFTVYEGVTLIGGYNKSSTTSPRHYPGEFVPFKTADLSATTEFTILDGNSYKRSLASQKHRVVRVENGGVVDGCLIRNGHIRNGNGGGVLLNGGKLYNSIVRGNVAMSHPDSAEALGGGVFIQANGELINCLVAYNMANDGYGVAAGTGGGKMINNTITANTYSPVFVKIPKITGFQMYTTNNSMNRRPAGEIPKWDMYEQRITLNEFYISRTLTTQGQYAVFCAATDITKSDNYGQLNITTLKGLTEPVKGGATTGTRYGFTTDNLQNILQVTTSSNSSGLAYDDGVWHPVEDTATVEYPMASVSWYGSLAYAVWLGGGLPTDAQWEFAARRNLDGTVSDNLYSGAYGTTSDNDTASWRILDSIAWVNTTKSIDTTPGDHFGKLGATWSSRPHEVARKRPNAMGIYDMTGNMHEWSGDCGQTVGVFPYTIPLSEDPILATNGNRALRGNYYYDINLPPFSLPHRSNAGAMNMTLMFYGFRPIAAF